MYRNRVLLQNGKGLGGLFKMLARFIVPLFKKSVPVVKQLVQSKSGKKIRKQVLKSAVNTATDLIQGTDPKKRLKKDLIKVAKIAKKSVNRQLNSRVNKKKIPPLFGKKRVSIFDK